jgi:hypothetical protein
MLPKIGQNVMIVNNLRVAGSPISEYLCRNAEKSLNFDDFYAQFYGKMDVFV